MIGIRFRLLPLLILLSLLLNPAAGGAAAPNWITKVSPDLIETLEAASSSQPVEFLVFPVEQADLSKAPAFKMKLEKGQYVFDQLRAAAARSQPLILAALRDAGAEVRPYWIVNMIWVRGAPSLVERMARRADVSAVTADPAVPLARQVPSGTLQRPAATQSVEWNIEHVGAPQVWQAGATGQGVVVAGQDTGYDWDHPALRTKYRGWNGSTAEHSYNWHDAIHENNSHTGEGNECDFDVLEPCDDSGHGTHTMGTMVGDDGQGNQIGMAPGARWIGCRNMEEGWGKPSTYIECFEFFLAPTDLAGQNPHPELAPDVINNSWACPLEEGCDPAARQAMQQVVTNVRAAGIAVIVSAGNSGPSCESIQDPPAIYEAAFSVGNTTSTDEIASSSSRGPVMVDGSGRLKPDVTAPGSGIRSSYLNGGYRWTTGTSMSAPHVSGLVALLLSADPGLRGQVDQIESVIEQSAVPLTPTPVQTCGGLPTTNVPNYVYGWGRIDAWAAFQKVDRQLILTNTVSQWQVQPGDLITYTLQVTNPFTMTVETGVVVSDTLPAGTVFHSATEPYQLSNGEIVWQAGSLEPGSVWQAELVVQLPADTNKTILLNEAYSVRSSNMPIPLYGMPVAVPVIPSLLYSNFIPFITNEGR